MADDRFQLALDHFERALARLHEVLAQPENEFIRDATIQRLRFWGHLFASCFLNRFLGRPVSASFAIARIRER